MNNEEVYYYDDRFVYVDHDCNEFVLPKCGFTVPGNRHFKAWEVGGEEYQPGDTIEYDNNFSVKAVWAMHSFGDGTICSGCGEEIRVL